MPTSVYFHESDMYPYQPIDSIWMIIYMLLSFIFFFIIDRTTKSAAKITTQDDLKKNWLRQNTLISFIHSSICSTLIIIAVLRAPEMLDDPLSHSNFFNYVVIAFSIGYFLWDFVDCLQNSAASIYPILFHHLLVITFLCHILVRTRNVGYALYALSLEINSVFLHARRLLRWYTPISPSVYFQQLLRLFIDSGNYITFIFFRFGIVLIALRALYIERNRLEPLVYLFTVISVCAIGILNMVLFYRLLKSQIGQTRKSKDKKLLDDNILITDNDILLPS